MDTREVIDAAVRALGRSWPQLLVTDIAYKLVAFVLLTPLLGLVVRLGVSFSGGSVLADQDILYFLLRPVGLVALLVIAALSLTIVALEQACLMTIGVGAAEGRKIGAGAALGFVAGRVRPVIGLALRLVARCLAWAAPFLAALGMVYLLLLGRFDINYYLSERPPSFLAAVGIAVVLVAGLAWVLVPRLIGWGLSLPLVLFEGLAPRQALSESVERVRGHRPPVARALVLWGLGALALSLVLPGAVLAAGRLVAPVGRGNVGLVLGLMLLLAALWGLANLVASFVAGSTFALLVVQLYESFGGGRGEIAERLGGAGELDSAVRLRVSPARILIALAALAALAGGLGYYLLDGVKGNDDIAIIAHRGAAGARPENTMASVEEALEQGADYVEIDVQETVDGRVVVMHDSDFMKVAGVDLKIWDATWEDLAAIDIGSWFAPEYAGERVPLLRDVIRRVRGKAMLTIELKYYGHDQQLEQRVVDIIEEEGATDDCVIMSLKYPALETMRGLRPDWRLGLLTATAIGDLAKLDADFLAVNTGLATRSFVRHAHGRDKDVYVWTVNDPIQMFRVMNLGVDGIITDEPGLARRVLDRRAELSSAERLLVGLAVAFGAAEAPPPASEDAA